MMNNVHKSSRCAKPGAVPYQQALVIRVVRFFYASACGLTRPPGE